MPKHETKLVNLILRKKRDGVNQIALVEDPAINSGWSAFSAKSKGKKFTFKEICEYVDSGDILEGTCFTEHRNGLRSIFNYGGDSKTLVLAGANKKKQMLYGAVMIPDKQILRVRDNGEKYFVKFEQEQINKMLHKYMSEARTNEFNLHHDANQQADVVTVESWIKGDIEDKSNAMGLSKVPSGSWIIGAKVNSPEIWAKVESGELTGFSLEGFFTEQELFSNSNQINNTYMSKPNGFTQKLAKALGFADEEPEKEQEKLEAVLTELADGGTIFYDEEQQAVFEVLEGDVQGEALGDGSYPLADGRILEVTGGIVSNITTEQEQSKETDENALIGVLTGMKEQIESLISTNEAMSKEIEDIKSTQKAFATQGATQKKKQIQTKTQTGVHRL